MYLILLLITLVYTLPSGWNLFSGADVLLIVDDSMGKCDQIELLTTHLDSLVASLTQYSTDLLFSVAVGSELKLDSVQATDIRDTKKSLNRILNRKCRKQSQFNDTFILNSILNQTSVQSIWRPDRSHVVLQLTEFGCPVWNFNLILRNNLTIFSLDAGKTAVGSNSSAICTTKYLWGISTNFLFVFDHMAYRIFRIPYSAAVYNITADSGKGDSLPDILIDISGMNVSMLGGNGDMGIVTLKDNSSSPVNDTLSADPRGDSTNLQQSGNTGLSPKTQADNSPLQDSGTQESSAALNDGSKDSSSDPFSSKLPSSNQVPSSNTPSSSNESNTENGNTVRAQGDTKPTSPAETAQTAAPETKLIIAASSVAAVAALGGLVFFIKKKKPLPSSPSAGTLLATKEKNVTQSSLNSHQSQVFGSTELSFSPRKLILNAGYAIDSD